MSTFFIVSASYYLDKFCLFNLLYIIFSWYFRTTRAEIHFVTLLLICRDGEVAFDVNERTADKIVEFMKE